MKRTLSLLVLACAAFVPALSGAEVDPVKKEALLKQVSEAFAKRDVAMIRALYETKGITKADIDYQTSWLAPAFDPQRKELFLNQLVFLPLDSTEIDASVRTAAKGTAMNGRSYLLNLPAVGCVKIFFSAQKDSEPGRNGWGSMLLVGTEPDGTLRFTLPAPQPRSTTGEETAAKAEAFVRRVDALYKAKDLEGIKYLHDWGTATPSAIDTTLWAEEYHFAHSTYEKAEYRPLASFSESTTNPAALKRITEGYTEGGTTYRPSLPVVGVVAVTFVDPNGSKGTNLHPFGLSEDGNYRFVSEVAVAP